ncbi:Carbon-nitrogen hydrolase, partial [Coemansia aciculifera]
MYDEQGAHLYGTGPDDGSAIDYAMMESGAGDTSSLAALTRAITSNDARQHAQEDDASQHGDGHDGATGGSPSSRGSGGQQGLGTPRRYVPQPLLLDGSDVGQGLVTPVKRPHSAHSGDGSSASRLKSKVWNWYDITDDGQRQCRFCMQKYGRLTATTILARHYHNRHGPNPPPMSAHTPSHRQSRPPQPHLSLPPVHAVYSQAAAAAAVAAAAAATPDTQGSQLFHPQTNGAGSDDPLRSASDDATQHAAGSYDDSQLIIQAGFSSMMNTSLSRIGLTPARKALAAVAQFCAQADPQKNLQTCVDLITTAARRGAQMVFLPEASDFILESRASQTAAQGLDGAFMKEIQQAAKDNSIWVSIGIHEQQPQTEGGSLLPFNTNAVVNEEGTLVSIYRKLHLFDVNVKDGPRFTESQVTARGDRAPEVVDTPLGKLGLAVCYD